MNGSRRSCFALVFVLGHASVVQAQTDPGLTSIPLYTARNTPAGVDPLVQFLSDVNARFLFGAQARAALATTLSTVQTTANAAIAANRIGAANGVAGLNASGVISTAQLPTLLAIGTTSGLARDAALAIAAENAASNAAAAAQSTANGRPVIGTTSGTARDAALGIAAETAAQNSANTNATNIAGIMSKMPANASAIAGTMYISTCKVTVNTNTPTSTFCATDGTSKRTYPANSLIFGKSFTLQGGGRYTVTLNTNTASIAVMVGTSTVVNITTPAAPIGTNQEVLFFAMCTVRGTTTIDCNGKFSFVVAGTGLSADAPFDTIGSTFDPTVANVIDVLGNWNGTVTTQTTTVSQAVLTALN